MNPKYQEIKTNYKDDDVFYFFRKGFEKEVDLVKNQKQRGYSEALVKGHKEEEARSWEGAGLGAIFRLLWKP